MRPLATSTVSRSAYRRSSSRADEGVVETFWDTIGDLEDRGATYHEVSLPSVEHAVEAYYVIAMSEASSNLARFDGVRYGNSGGYDGNWNEAFSKAREEGSATKSNDESCSAPMRSLPATTTSTTRKPRTLARGSNRTSTRRSRRPTCSRRRRCPFRRSNWGGLEDPLQMYLADANTVPVNLADLPAISVPAGETDGLPVGLQLVGPAFGEKQLIEAASALA